MDQLEKASAAIAAIKANPNDVEAWLMLSQTATSPEQQKTFLKRALLIDPDNSQAMEQLAALERPSSPEPQPASEAASEEPAPAPAKSPETISSEGTAVAAAETATAKTVTTEDADEEVAQEADTLQEEAATGATEVEETPTVGEMSASLGSASLDANAVTAVPAAPEISEATEPDTTDSIVADDPELLEPEPVYKDPFEFEEPAEDEALPPWLLGEPMPEEESSLPTSDTSDGAASEREGADESGKTEPKQPENEAEQTVEGAPPVAEAALQSATATQEKSRQQESRKRRSALLEWLAVLLILAIFMLLIFLLVG